MNVPILTDEEIEGYRRRVTGVETCPGISAKPQPGALTPAQIAADPCLSRAKSMLDNWHLRNLATHDDARAKIRVLTEALKGFADGECHCDECHLAKCVQCAAKAALLTVGVKIP